MRGKGVEAIMRDELEAALNELLKLESTTFLNYKKYDPIGYNYGTRVMGVSPVNSKLVLKRLKS